MADRFSLLHEVLSAVQAAHVTLSELFCFVIVHTQFNGPNDILFQDIVLNVRPILTALHDNAATANAILGWTEELAHAQYAGAVSQLTQVSSGWHFSMAQASPTQVEDFRIDDMADHFERTEPTLWALVVELLGGWAQPRKGARPVPSPQGTGAVPEGDPEDDEFWDGDDILDVSATVEQPSNAAPKPDRHHARRNLLTRVVSLTRENSHLTLLMAL